MRVMFPIKGQKFNENILHDKTRFPNELSKRIDNLTKKAIFHKHIFTYNTESITIFAIILMIDIILVQIRDQFFYAIS